MCRIFGFRSVLLSKVHSSLVSAENALMGQSKKHPDGWGLVYYIADSPHVIKSTTSAESDELFKQVSGIVTSQTVLAHIRKATHGKLTLLNTHPFQFGKWTFAHNGNIKNFEIHKQELRKKISPEILPYCLGDTDSEIIFYVLLSYIKKKVNLHEPHPDLKIVMTQLGEGLKDLTELIGELTIKECGVSTDSYLTFVMSNGPIMLAFNGGLTLYYSTHKKKCPERDTCGSFSTICETKAEPEGKINHLIFSSEPLQGENLWYQIDAGTMIGVDQEMRLKTHSLILPFVASKTLEEV